MDSPPSQSRFKVSKRVIRHDKLMRQIIRIGGLIIIASVFGIFVFILSQALPLFYNANLKPLATFELKEPDLKIIGLDEWGEIPFAVTGGGKILFLDSFAPEIPPRVKTPLGSDAQWQLYRYDSKQQRLLFGSPNGKAVWVNLIFEPDFSTDKRTIQYELELSPSFDFQTNETESAESQEEFIDLALGIKNGTGQLAALTRNRHKHFLKILTLKREESLLEQGEMMAGNPLILSDSFPTPPQFLRIQEEGDAILVVLESGEVQYFTRSPSGWALQESFIPFAGQANPEIESLDYLLGDESIFLSQTDGTNAIFSLVLPEGENQRRWVKIKEFENLPQGASAFARSLRNRGFALTSGNLASLNYGTTASVRWQKRFSKPLVDIALSKKYHRLGLLEEPNRFHLYKLEDPHPEGGWKAFFGKIWYEGGSKPEYSWQSSGGSDAFEPKLSMIPLILGTLKGTFYALLFSVPIAILAALYTSEFLDHRLKKIVKPIMEIMASLPSVILGFLAALWLAPRIETKIPSTMLVILSLPLAVFLFGILVQRLPRALKAKIEGGHEWMVLTPVVLLVIYVAWISGPWLESWAFQVPAPDGPGTVGDFRLWWTQNTGQAFEQRNSLVVGLMMGFAVIPIIFTLVEESLSSVPNSLRSASLALGASRWQTAFRIVIPAATTGIFSGIIIGFGRAVGETMIVLMATGNTPIMDFNIFSGMRTLSANLAVELPEAPFQSTLYRTLFLGALILFLMTFAINSIAEFLGQRIKKKYKAR